MNADHSQENAPIAYSDEKIKISVNSNYAFPTNSKQDIVVKHRATDSFEYSMWFVPEDHFYEYINEKGKESDALIYLKKSDYCEEIPIATEFIDQGVQHPFTWYPSWTSVLLSL